MAKDGSPNVSFILIDGVNVVVHATDQVEDTEALLEQTDALGDSWFEFLPTGLRKAMLAINGFFDDAADNINAVLAGSAQQTSRIICYGFKGNTVGKKFVGLAGAFGAKYTRIASRGVLHKANAEYSVSGEKDEGLILHALGARASDGNSEGADSVDHGAQTTNGGIGYAQVTGLSGFTGLVLKIRHSADDSTYADLVTFALAGVGSERQSLSTETTVNRHLATSWDVTGSGQVTFFIGFRRR